MVQDDQRENDLIAMFGLKRPPDATRGGTDAILAVDGAVVEFELKSTTTDSVTTVRDFSADHVQKWKGKHWLIGFYDRAGETLHRCLYGSPLAMEPWIRSRETYIAPDVLLAARASDLVGQDLLVEILGDKKSYSLHDAQRIQKSQLSAEQYAQRMDLADAYSSAAMLGMLKERCAYLIRRGSTLNNPHINASYFNGRNGPGTDAGPGSWWTVEPRTNARLVQLVREATSAISHPPAAIEAAIAEQTENQISELEAETDEG